jgi:hypothetical protein
MATITFDQVGLSAGVTDTSRSDGLANGAVVTITVSPGGGVVEFVDVPDVGGSSTSTLHQVNVVTWAFTPTSQVYGTWLVQYTPVAGNPVRRTFAVRTPRAGLRVPAFNEKSSIVATLATGSSFVGSSDTNEGGSYRGWFTALKPLYDFVESRTSLSLDVTGPASGVNVAVNQRVFVNVSGGTVSLQLPSATDGDQVTVKLTSLATNSCTILPTSGLIDGQSSLVLNTDFEWAILVRRASNWFQVG